MEAIQAIPVSEILTSEGISPCTFFPEPIQLRSALWISKIEDLKHVPVPTAEIKVDPTGNYSEIPYIIKLEPTFKLAGGINLPKIISCHGSDEKKSRQLVKVLKLFSSPEP